MITERREKERMLRMEGKGEGEEGGEGEKGEVKELDVREKRGEEGYG